MSDNGINSTHYNGSSSDTEPALPFGVPALLSSLHINEAAVNFDHAIAPFESLPTETLYQVFSNLTFADCIRLSAVSRTLRHAVLSFPELGCDLSSKSFSRNTLQMAHFHKRCIDRKHIRVLKMHASVAVDVRNIGSTEALRKMLNLLAAYRYNYIEKATISLHRFYDEAWFRELSSIASHSLKRLYLALDVDPHIIGNVLSTILTGLPNLAILSLKSNEEGTQANAGALMHVDIETPRHDFSLPEPHTSLGYLRFEFDFATGPVSAGIFRYLPNLRKLVFSSDLNAPQGDPVYPYLISLCPKLKLVRHVQKFSRRSLRFMDHYYDIYHALVRTMYRNGTYSIVEPDLIAQPSVVHNIFIQKHESTASNHTREFQFFGAHTSSGRFNMAQFLTHLCGTLVRMELEVSFAGSLIEMDAYRFPQLQELVIRYDSDQPNERLEPTLRWIDFSQTRKILQRSPNLQVVKLEKIFVQNEIFAALAALRHLQSVELIQCPNINDCDHDAHDIPNLIIV